MRLRPSRARDRVGDLVTDLHLADRLRLVIRQQNPGRSDEAVRAGLTAGGVILDRPRLGGRPPASAMAPLTLVPAPATAPTAAPPPAADARPLTEQPDLVEPHVNPYIAADRGDS
jgi:hypothetical protein